MFRFRFFSLLILCVLAFLGTACGGPGGDDATDAGGDLNAEAQAFLDSYQERMQGLYTAASEAEWASNTRILEGDDSNSKRTAAAQEALALYTGSVEVIDRTQELLAQRDALEPLQVRQLEAVLYQAASNPQTVPDLVKQRIAAETAQVETLFGFEFQVDGKAVSANDIDDTLVGSDDVAERLAYWNVSKDVGKDLKAGLGELVGLRNGAVQALGYDNFFHYQVSDYGMSSEELMQLNRSFVRDIWPLYRQLHTWTRHHLAERYGQPVPEQLPAHWLPNRWGQDWSDLVTVEGIDLDAALEDKEAEWVVKEAEAFYVSLGFDALPPVFWEKSSLYPAPEGVEWKKNNHASAWHMDLENDVRSLMSVQANQRWWETTHHELGHIYYYMSYSRPEVPLVLRSGANRGFHEAIGTLLGFASTQRAFLVEKGMVGADVQPDPVQQLLKKALDTVVFIPFSSGTMTHFEHDLYTEDLPIDQFNQRWWQHAADFQGIVPPEPRGEQYCDAASKTHINNDAAQYYDYAISHIVLHQVHDHIAKEILQQDPHDSNYWGREDVGTFLDGILRLGATQDWRQVMRDQLGQELSAQAMVDFFAPLMEYLEEQNEGRQHTLPETPPEG